MGTYRHVGLYLPSKAANYIVRDDTSAEMAQEIRDLDAVEAVVTPYGSALVELYFRIVHPSFPVLHKKVFLEKHGRTYRELTPLGLAAVYILALNWWSYSPALTNLSKPDVKELDKLVSGLLLDSLRRAKVSDLQGILVLLQRPDFDSWPLTSQLVATAQDLGLHDDCSEWNLPDWEPGVRKRVAWALYAQDKCGALVYGRPSHIDSRNWNVRVLGASDFPETSLDDDDVEGSVEVETGRQIFVHFVALTQIISDILDTFFTLKPTIGNSTAEILERAKPLQIRLGVWYAGLPPRLSMQETKSRKLSSSGTSRSDPADTGYLHLAYAAADITLHRAILRAYDHSILDPSYRASLRAAATSRLLSTIDFSKQLKPAHLQSFWHSASKHYFSLVGTLGCLLWSTSETVQEREMYKAALSEYRWTLRISSTGVDFLKLAIGSLDASPVFAPVPDTPPVQNASAQPPPLDDLQDWLFNPEGFNEDDLVGTDSGVQWSTF